MTTRTARVVRWLVRHIPAPILDSPERVLINFACILIGAGALLSDPQQLLGLWPRWIALEWSAALLLGGVFALVGYWNEKRPLARLGYMLLMISGAIYGVSVLIVFGWGGFRVGAIFLGIAVAKGIRLLLGSAIRNAILETGRERNRP